MINNRFNVVYHLLCVSNFYLGIFIYKGKIMSKVMRKYIDTFKKFNLNESVTNEYKRDEDDDDSPIIIEGELEYGDYLFDYKVEYHDDFGYQVLELTSQDIEDVEDFFDEDEYEELLDLIIDDVKPKRYKEKEISTEWVAIDTRNGRVIHRSKNHIDRKFVAEWYDIPTSFIEITTVEQKLRSQFGKIEKILFGLKKKY